MLRRLFLVFLPSLTASTSFANSADWSCQQDKNTNEWVCLGDQTSAVKPTPIAPPVVEPITPPAPVSKAPIPAPRVIAPQPEPSSESIPPAPKILATPEKIEAPTPPAVTEAVVKPPSDDILENFNIGLIKPVFDHQQEQLFSQINSRLKTDPWENCTLQLAETAPDADLQAIRNKTPLDVKSNYSEIFDNEIGNYSGKVEMNRADQHAHADKANYDSVSETLDLQGNVFYNEEQLSLHSSTATLKLAADQAVLRDTLFISAGTPLRGSAKAVFRDSRALSHYKDVTYTSCRPGNQDWVIHASELKINKDRGRGAANNAWVEFKGVPVFYSPYLAFPVDNRRLSGFLPPTFGNTQSSGFNFSSAYYWNIAPNYDATISPVYYDERGVLLGGNFRYLTSKSNGKITAEYMPDDRKLNDNRYHLMLKNVTQLTEHLSADVDVNNVSDKNYFAELGNALRFPNFSFIRSQGALNYRREGVSLVARAESYQTLDSSLTGRQIPYRRLPQINLNLNHSFNFMPLDANLESESVNFQHSSLVDGQRVNLRPSLSFPLHTASSYVTPKISVQHTEYFLNNQQASLPKDIERTVPIMSVDTGSYFERDLNIGDKPYLHTLEPRLFYLYIPKTNQSQIPLFDTSVYDFWYNSLFRENRFSGSDRIQDANQLSVALTSRLIDPMSGRERLKLNIGQIFYFRNREVTLDLANSPVETSRTSPLVGELGSEISKHLAVESGVQWDPHSNRIVRGKATIHYTHEANQLINLGYLYRQDPLVNNRDNDITQSDMSFRWPVIGTWYAIGRWQYSWLYNRTVDGFFGVEKENCCWRFRVIGRSYINSINQVVNPISQAVEGSTQTGIFFQIELKGLTGLGTQLDDFFATSIYGYQKPKQ